MKPDIQLPKFDVELVNLSASQVQDWGHRYLKAQDFYGTSRGEDAIIFVLDTAGTFADHPDLEPNTLTEYEKTFTSEAAKDGHGHGTHCGGIAAAADNSVGVKGIAPGAKLAAIKVLTNGGSGSFTWVAQALRYIADLPDTGAIKGKKRIATMSLGGPAGQPSPSVLDQAIRYAVSKGVFIVAAAGNSGFNGNNSTVGAPGNHPLVISVAATSQPGTVRAPYSSGGKEVDLTAPGTGVYSTYKDGGYAKLSGTSMACPQVAGVMALLLSANPEIVNQEQLLAYMTANATDILATGRDDESGWGSPVLTGYIGQEPGDGPIDDDPEEDPNDDPVDEPEHPEVPMRPEIGTGIYPFPNNPYSVLWKQQGQQGMATAFFEDIEVEVTSKVEATTVADAVRQYALGFFAGRGIVLRPGQDLLDCAIWTAAFLQFISDDQWIVDRVGFALDLTVRKLTIVDRTGNRITVTQEQVAARVKEIEHSPAIRFASLVEESSQEALLMHMAIA